MNTSLRVLIVGGADDDTALPWRRPHLFTGRQANILVHIARSGPFAKQGTLNS